MARILNFMPLSQKFDPFINLLSKPKHPGMVIYNESLMNILCFSIIQHLNPAGGRLKILSVFNCTISTKVLIFQCFNFSTSNPTHDSFNIPIFSLLHKTQHFNIQHWHGTNSPMLTRLSRTTRSEQMFNFEHFSQYTTVS